MATTSIPHNPCSGGLPWAIQKVAPLGWRTRWRLPWARISFCAEFEDGAARKRVGLLPRRSRTYARRHADCSPPTRGRRTDWIDHIGGFWPHGRSGPLQWAMSHRISAIQHNNLRGNARKRMPAHVSALPFTPANFKR